MDRNGEAVHLKLLDEGDVPRRGRRVHCKAMRKLLRAEVERVNATLRKYEWRAMSKPEDLGIRTPWSYANAELASQPPGKRPLQYIEHQKHLILRDPGVQVLHDAATGWTTADPDCTNTPSVEALVIDLPTGLALTRLYSRCTCFGSEAVETHVLRLSDRARAEIIQRAPVGRAVLTAEEA
jgi:hypothetical protein